MSSTELLATWRCFGALALLACGTGEVSKEVETGDTQPPTVALTSPAGPTTYWTAQTVALVASSTDNVGTTRVEIYDGTQLVHDDAAAPFELAWTITDLDNGTHDFTARAFDGAGNSATSNPLVLTVSIPVEGEDCSATLTDVSMPLCDGKYPQAIAANTFAAGSVIRALHPGKVRLTGSFAAGDNLTFVGLVIDNGDEKHLGSNNLYEDMSFVGGPPCGNSVNVDLGSNTTIRRSAMYGRGGRYQVLAWQVTGVTLEDILIRTDGGWGEGDDTCNEWEPNAALNFYDTSSALCRRCVLFDGIVTASSESETLGGLGVGCHLSTAVMQFDNCLIVDSQGGFWADGLGTCSDVSVTDSATRGLGDLGLIRNVLGTTTATRFSTDSGCGVWKGSINLIDSAVSGLNDGCGGSTSGAGSTPALDPEFLNRARWRTELCDEQGVTRGWCGTTQTLSQYLLP